jgi:YggT family protein
MRSLVLLIWNIIEIYKWVVIAQVILSWLIAFNIINTYNRFVASIGDVLYRLTEPALRPLRNLLPNLGGVDISPVLLILLLWFIQNLLLEYFV